MDLFAPYLNDDGVVKRLTVFHDLDYSDEKISWRWYRNREDLLDSVEKDNVTKQIIENYANYRPDFLRCKFQYVKTHILCSY